MNFLTSIQHYFQAHSLPILALIGLVALLSFYFGKLTKAIRLPLIIGYMFFGVLIGPSFLGIFSQSIQSQLSFITEIALGFVALTIGLELNLNDLKKQGSGIISIIFAESFGAFILVFFAVLLVTKNIPLALIFGSIAPASAPAGTVAVIKEYRAKGTLTKALYAVVGFDDGLGIILFGFASAIAKNILLHQTGSSTGGFFSLILTPLKEIALSIIIGLIVGALFCILVRKLKSSSDYFIHIFGIVLLMVGLSHVFHLSLILTNMTAGILIINTQRRNLIETMHRELTNVIPLLFILFFTLAGTNLRIGALPSLGLLGVVYIIARSAGLIGGSRLGSLFGKVSKNVRNYVGLGILSQAGVAIGLSLIVKQDFSGLGKVIESTGKSIITSGDQIGTIVITTVTATCIFFEIIGPILTKIALKKAGEINVEDSE
jgi:Kef-type K+ transport system membrane component KefB